MSQPMIACKACTLVAVNTDQTKDRLGFNVVSFLTHLETVLDAHVTYWNQLDFGEQDIRTLASDVKQVQKRHAFGRTLLFGADLENHVTAIALRFLAEGFETYLLKDLTSSLDGRFESVHEMRLFSIGVIPTTMGQVLMEWIAFESDPDMKHRLTETLTLYRQLLMGTPR